MNYSKRLTEIFFGIVILITVFIFLIYVSLNIFKKRTSYYTIRAKFNEIGGLSTGAQVMLHGVVIGSVSKVAINKEYNVEVYLSINSDVKIPLDSTATIKDTSFFSGRKVEIYIGKSKQFIKDGAKLVNTVDYMYLEDKISNALFNSSSKKHDCNNS